MIRRLRALQDNWVWLVVDEAAGLAAVVDPSEAAPVVEAVTALGVRLAAIWNTHHHGDHVGGNEELLRRFGPLEVHAGEVDRGRIPGLTHGHVEGDSVRLGAIEARVMFVPGHTRGHVAYLAGDALFCGDTLFGAGCGRLFEGTPAEMQASLARLRALPDDTAVHCAHEYTWHNLRFAVQVEPGNAALQARYARVAAAPDEPTVPTRLGEEKATNPMLRWDAPELRALAGADRPADVFAAVRSRKDRWRG